MTPDGNNVYWTCRTAGVILRATRVSDQPGVTSPSSMEIGTTVRFFLDAPGEGGKCYLAASSLGLGPISIDSRNLALALDDLFALTFFNNGTPAVTGYAGILDSTGMGTAHLVIPDSPSLHGLRVNTAFAVVDGSAPSGLSSLSRTHTFSVQ